MCCTLLGTSRALFFFFFGIAGGLTETSSWFSKIKDDSHKGEKQKRGAQIDLLIDRRDRVINLCEIKFSINDYMIDADYEKALRNKIDAFKRETATKKSVQLTMITTYGVKKNKYSNRVQSEVVLNDLFEE